MIIRYDINLFPANLKKYRLAGELTQLQISDKLNISTQSYSRIERGKITPSTDFVQDVSKILDVPIASFISDKEPLKYTNANIHEYLNSISETELRDLAIVLEAIRLDTIK